MDVGSAGHIPGHTLKFMIYQKRFPSHGNLFCCEIVINQCGVAIYRDHRIDGDMCVIWLGMRPEPTHPYDYNTITILRWMSGMRDLPF